MSVNETLEQDIRKALQPLRPDPKSFEAGIKDRIEAGDEAKRVVVRSGSPWLRTAASFVPIPLLVGSKVVLAGAKSTPPSVGAKVLGYAAIPAASVFLMFGAFVFSLFKIRATPASESGGAESVQKAVQAWWRRHWWIAVPFYTAAIALIYVGNAEVFFCVLLVSAIALAYLLGKLSQEGLATRSVISGLCLTGLALLSIAVPMASASRSTVQLLSPDLLRWVFHGGMFLLFVMWPSKGSFTRSTKFAIAVMFTVMVGPLALLRVSRAITRPPIGEYVTSFRQAEHHTATWKQWSMPTQSLRERQPVDLSTPRALFEEELAGKQNPYVLNVAARVGLLELRDVARIRKFDRGRSRLFHARYADRPLGGTQDQQNWLVRVLALQGALSSEERDFLENRLHACINKVTSKTYGALQDIHQVAELLDVIGRPMDVDARRPQVHEVLRDCYCPEPKHNEPGGFQTFRLDQFRWGSPEGTWYALRLMRRFGVPEGIDFVWVRSFLRVAATLPHDGRYVAQAAQLELGALPVPPVTWRDYLRHERVLWAAILLVLLCLYATWRAPVAARTEDD